IGVIGLLVSLGAWPATAAQSRRISAELNNNLIYLPVSVNGSAPLWFILDSGADNFVVDARSAVSLGLKPTRSVTVNGFGEQKVSASIANHVSLRIGGEEFHDKVVVVYPFDQLESVVGRRIDGVIGSDVFRRFVVEIDYENHDVTLFDPRIY